MSVPFNAGDKVRILERKEKLIKENRNSVKNYIPLITKEGYKIIVKDEKRKLQPSELLTTTTVSKPIPQAYIDRAIKSKEIAKIQIN
jgi:hypothetical protein